MYSIVHVGVCMHVHTNRCNLHVLFALCMSVCAHKADVLYVLYDVGVCTHILYMFSLYCTCMCVCVYVQCMFCMYVLYMGVLKYQTCK